MRKTRIYLEVVIILILSFMMIGCKKYEKAPPQSLLTSKKECRLCGSGKNSLKTIYKNLSGVGVLCLNDWRMVGILTSNDAAISFLHMGGQKRLQYKNHTDCIKENITYAIYIRREQYARYE